MLKWERKCWHLGTRRFACEADARAALERELENEALSDQELVKTYKDQGGVERGFHFLKDPLFLASSVTDSKPERIIALPCDHGALLAGLSFSRIPAAGTLGRDRADDSRPGTQTYSTPDDAVGLSMF